MVKAFLFNFYIMKKIIFSFMFFMSYFVVAQTPANPWRLTVATSAIDIYSENQLPSSGINNFDNAEYNDLFDLLNSLQVARYISPSFAIEGTFAFNNILESSSNTNDQDAHFTFDAGVLVSLKGLKKFRNKLKRFDPALKAGLSYSDLESAYITPYAGLSLTYWMSDSFGLTVQTVNKYYSDDLIKSTTPGLSYYQYSVGISYGFGDGDTDADGVKDSVDACIDVPGLPALNGCPDDDNDGIRNTEDACPLVAGLAAFNGCPDTDGDGIKDSEDNCPEIAGVAALNGCPDADADGITDADDLCPNAAGSKALNGCPDADADNVADKDDQCPAVAGPASNNGCPLNPLSDLSNLSVSFEIAKSAISENNMVMLKQVLVILNANASASIVLSGHTDNSGAEKFNQKLSMQRADEVKNYLVENGIDESRLKAIGQGESSPRASNDTLEGRGLNRRVDFNVE
jgi:outer membrane protein OmpA-like peptidoglycan-associated protein